QRAREFLKRGYSVGRGDRQYVYFNQSLLKKIAQDLESIIGTEAIKQIFKEEQSSSGIRKKFKDTYSPLATIRERDQIYTGIINWRISLEVPEDFKDIKKLAFKHQTIHKWIYLKNIKVSK